MNTPLEDQVHDALQRRVDPIQHAPLTVSDVRHRARRIQRRRAAVAGVAVAAALAIAVPVGLSATGPNQRSEVPPATQTPSPSPTPTVASGTVQVNWRTAEVVEETPVPLLDVDGPTLITPDGTLDLRRVYDSVTPYLDGWAAVARNDAPGVPDRTIEFLDADMRLEGGGNANGGLVVRPDGQRIAWSEYDGTRWRVVVADPAGDTEPVATTFPPASELDRVEPVGFISDDQVAVRALDSTGYAKVYAAGGGDPVELPGLLNAEAASPALGVVAGLSEQQDDTCSAVVDAVAGGGGVVWDTCDHGLGPFSATGRYVVGSDPEADGYGSPRLTLLDAATGEEVVTFEAEVPRRTVGGFYSQMAWVGDEALVVRLFTGEDSYMMRLGVDGSVQRIGIESAGPSGLSVAVPS